MLSTMQLVLTSWSLAAPPMCEIYRPADKVSEEKGVLGVALSAQAPACASGR